jgi:hypothetical protein
MKKMNQKSVLLTGLFALLSIAACTNEEVQQVNDEQQVNIEEAIDVNATITHKECKYVDSNWPSSATLATTLQTAVGTAAEGTYMFNQNTAIKTFWRGSSVAAPTFRFVRNGINYSSTYNAISYGNGKIYFGEGIFKAAKAKDASNLVNVMILAHEYGHQLQYAFNLPSVKENTARAGELEADGTAGYYLRRGLGKTSFSSIATAYEFAASIGDNNTTSAGHHGTSAQRRSAVRLGFLLADPANAKLSATAFDSNFFYYYDGVLKGTYKLVRPAGISKQTHSYILAHMAELAAIANGTMSDEEYFNLD